MKVLKPTTIPFPSNGQFIRNSTATYIEDGILKTAAINEPRWQDGKLLLESESSNRIPQSQDINLSPWSGGFRTLAAEFWAGTVPFFKVTKALAITSEAIRSGVLAVAAGSTWTMTLALLADNKTTCTVGIFANVTEGAGGYWGAPSECTKEIISGPGVFSIYSTAVGSLWHVDGLSDTEPTLIRITRTLAPTSTVTTFSCMVYPGRATSTTIGDAVKITRVQMEPGFVATSYIPTAATAVTRQADICVGNFSRSSTATYIDNAGVLQTAAVNVPRIEGNQLLIEEQGVNLKAGSEYFDNTTYWVPSAVSLTANQVGPDGLNTAMKVTETSATSAHSVGSMTSYSGLFTFSLFAKPAERSWIRLILGGSTKQVWFNLSTATVGTTGSQVVSSSIKTLASGWCRVSVTVNSSTVVTPFIAIATADGVESYLGVVSSGLFIFGAQVELNSSPTSYIPTTTTSASRSADIHSAGLVYTNATDARPLWSNATTYSTGQVIRYNNTVYESLQNINLNKQPDANPTWWLSLGADNISAAFDGKVGSKTITTDKLRMIVYPGTVVDAIGYLETNASIVNTSAIDSEKTVVYYNSTGVTETSIQNWYDYFFVSPLADPATQVVHQGIPSLDPGLFISVEMIKPGTVEVGSVLTGYSTTIGKTQYGLKAGIVDYSKKESDEFGNVSIVERPYSKRMQGDVYVANFDLNKVQRFLYNIRATPVLWMASDNPELAEVSYVYGFYKDFSTTISYPDVSMCNLDIEGLI